jgi:hypothetical protein
MYQNCCKKCGSIALHTEVKGNNTGLYCDDCGAWVKWLGKDELRAFNYNQMMSQMRETTPEENKAISDYLDSISKPTGVNIFDDKTIIERLTEFIEYLDKEIDSEYENYPPNVEDCIRKNAYCFALQKVKCSIENIIAGRDFNDMEE